MSDKMSDGGLVTVGAVLGLLVGIVGMAVLSRQFAFHTATCRAALRRAHSGSDSVAVYLESAKSCSLGEIRWEVK